MQANEIYRLSFSETQRGLRSTRVGLLHQRTGVPLFLLYLEGLSEVRDFRCTSMEGLENLASSLTSPRDQKAVLQLAPFFEEGASLLQILMSPIRSSTRKSRLSQFMGSSSGYKRSSGLHLLENLADSCDIIAIPQVHEFLTPEEAQSFAHELLDRVSKLSAVFALMDCPPKIGVSEAVEWAAPLSSPDGALYYPSLAIRGERISSLPVLAALYQKTDHAKGIAELPTLSPLQSAALPYLKLSPTQQMELLSGGINSIVMSPGSGHARIWGGHTLAKPPDMEFCLIPVRRTLRALREALETIAESYVLEPITADMPLDVEYRIRNFLEEHRNLFDLYSKDPYSVRATFRKGPSSDGIEIHCGFRLSRCLQELKLNFEVAQA